MEDIKITHYEDEIVEYENENKNEGNKPKDFYIGENYIDMFKNYGLFNLL